MRVAAIGDTITKPNRVFAGDAGGPMENDDVTAFIAGWESVGLIGAFN